MKCAAHPEPEVSAATFGFWSRLLEITSGDHGCVWCSGGNGLWGAEVAAGNGVKPEVARMRNAPLCHIVRPLTPISPLPLPSACSNPALEALKGQLSSIMLELARQMISRLRFPPDFAGWTEDRRDDFKHTYRYDVADVLLVCCEVAGWRDVLLMMAARLQEELGVWTAAIARAGAAGAAAPGSVAGWEGVEAAMYAIRAIARYVPYDEDTVLRSLFHLVHQLPPHIELRATSFRLIGRYAGWMSAHPDMAAHCLSFVVTHGLLGRPDDTRESRVGRGGTAGRAFQPLRTIRHTSPLINAIAPAPHTPHPAYVTPSQPPTRPCARRRRSAPPTRCATLGRTACACPACATRCWSCPPALTWWRCRRPTA